MKTEQTEHLENLIWRATHKMGVFGCFEVTIGWFGKERVDFMTYDTKGIWRCYEVKVTKSDFCSKNHNSFIGHFNYYVMPEDLYEKVKQDIPKHIGVYVEKYGHAISVKKAIRQKLGEDEQILKNSLIRSLCREVGKQISSGNKPFIEVLDRQLRQAERQHQEYHDKYWGLRREIEELYGPRWNKKAAGDNG
ncbi:MULTISPECIES: hypothetical protein [unclassified Dehalobacter]|uniref:hypothetical protein n=1 Tax=unclassified Dehalobacter TaxID=2635733 RepID=UPI00105150C8|nr:MULTISPECIES: hypothetical protein [unclassified Dehalobacter]TCX51955.1 hypothetical protein C1I36_06455 [Dehalobacter sp. 14DCB1]TCX53015.1 hypothetical protein C1I38_08135 [Dehalobacter sp. 12DCB1]